MHRGICYIRPCIDFYIWCFGNVWLRFQLFFCLQICSTPHWVHFLTAVWKHRPPKMKRLLDAPPRSIHPCQP